jgi:beta-mannosidase
LVDQSETRLPLTGKWLVQPDWDSSTIRKLPPNAFREDEWLPAEVPGVVHTDLMRAGKIPDPFVDENEKLVQWVGEIGWKYRTSFEVSGEFISSEYIELHAEGLDTFANIYINGSPVGSTDNMFVPHDLDIKSILEDGENRIEIVFASAIHYGCELEKKHGKLEVALDSFRVYARKAQYSFGWDWGPKLATCGIWRPIYLIAHRSVRLQNLAINSTVDDSLQNATVRVDLDSAKEASLLVDWKLTLRGPEYSSTLTSRSADDHESFEFKIEKPHLWWPNGYGAQHFYHIDLSAVVDGKEQFRIGRRIGLRQVELQRRPEDDGESFRFRVNNVPVFCKGANWIPADSFLSRLTNDKYRALLTMARDANMNMVRVWGGGIYEPAVFYDICDELGLMVWQDFMFACAGYPDCRMFLNNVNDEVKATVRQLRHHPCIVLWCGNNENEWLWHQATGRPIAEMSGARIFDTIIPEILASEDPARPYWQSSPFGGDDPNAENMGNRHKWDMWSGWTPACAVKNDRSRFVTEFGFQAPACLETWREYVGKDALSPKSAVVQHHNKQVKGTERLCHFLAEQFNVPEDFEEFVYKSQITQAESLKICIEHWRSRKFLTSGALFWQLNDCWPVTSWSVIDCELRPKAAYWYARRFFAPLIVVCRENEETFEFYAVNDTMEEHSLTLEISSFDFHGNSNKLHRTPSKSKENQTTLLVLLEREKLSMIDPSRQYIRARLLDGKKCVAENRHFFLPPKHLRLTVPNLNTCLSASKHGNWRLNIKSDCFVKALQVLLPDDRFQLSDNFFDLDGGEEKVIDIFARDKKAKLSTSDITFRWIE